MKALCAWVRGVVVGRSYEIIAKDSDQIASPKARWLRLFKGNNFKSEKDRLVLMLS